MVAGEPIYVNVVIRLPCILHIVKVILFCCRIRQVQCHSDLPNIEAASDSPIIIDFEGLVQVARRSSIFFKDSQHFLGVHLESTDAVVRVGMQPVRKKSQVIFRITAVEEDFQSDIIAEVLRRGHVQVPQEYVQVEVLSEDELDEFSL